MSIEVKNIKDLAENLDQFWYIKMKVSGWLAQFRDPYTLTSKLTIEIPAKSMLLGLLFAKIGLIKFSEGKEIKDLYSSYKNKTFFAIAYENKKVVKYFDYVNYINKEFGQKPTRIEYLVNPKFEILCILPKEDKYFGEDNKTELINYEFFKPYLGSNECPATIDSIKETKIFAKKVLDFESKFVFLADFMHKNNIEIKDKQYKNYVFGTFLTSFPGEEKHTRDICLVPLSYNLKLKSKEDITLFYEKEEENNYFMVF
jgi:CRISPR-associated protein Cas5 subtype I-B